MLVAGVFGKSAELGHFKEILLVEADCQDDLHRTEYLTLGQLEDLVRQAVLQLSDEKEKGGQAHAREDAKFLKDHKLRPARVDVEKANNSQKLAAAYGDAFRALAEWRVDPVSVYFWDRDKKRRLLTEQLEVVKNSWLQSRKMPVDSSDSEEEFR